MRHAAPAAQPQLACCAAAQAADGYQLAPARNRGEVLDRPHVPESGGEDQLAHGELEGEGLGRVQLADRVEAIHAVSEQGIGATELG
eukprot:CAMPEP_0180065010 /NCGR_PEP_ID=MMETSP0985-20121206/8490_1 /TAXON_ID=483367 /ORGANISM="non described non described, Strain CCMP 2436" /LENGTH=86 /DNA_ID=CAMNT_0021995357 /DNA_START=435 /DNA_END=692 /DNA_ORIENTATION=+